MVKREGGCTILNNTILQSRCYYQLVFKSLSAFKTVELEYLDVLEVLLVKKQVLFERPKLSIHTFKKKMLLNNNSSTIC